jgi:hypothetical protein
MSDGKQAPRDIVAGALKGWSFAGDGTLAADRVFAALAEAGYAIVPVEPTAEMWASVNLIERGHVSKLCSVEGWRAMLDAAKVAR